MLSRDMRNASLALHEALIEGRLTREMLTEGLRQFAGPMADVAAALERAPLPAGPALPEIRALPAPMAQGAA